MLLCLASATGWAQVDAPSRKERPAPADVQPENQEPSTSPVDVPDSNPGRELKWVLDVINGEAPGDVASHFAERYLQVYKVKEITEVLTTLREKPFQGAKVELTSVEEEDLNSLALSGSLHGAGTRTFLTVFLSLDEKTQKIAGLVFTPAAFSPVGQGSEGPDQMQAEVGGSILFGAYEIIEPKSKSATAAPADDATKDDSTTDEPPRNISRSVLNPIYEFGSSDGGAIAGLVRLWVLDALGAQVADRTLSWNQEIAVRDEDKCIPGGETSSLEAGTTLPVSDLVERMCARADTTALEHLFRTVSREKVEEVVTRDTPQTHKVRVPVLSVREMFALKLAQREVLVTDYLTDPLEKQREKLAPGGEIRTLEPDWAGLETWTEPRLVEAIGFFAIPESLAATLADLKKLHENPACEHLLDGLAEGVPIDLDQARWPKGYGAWASEPGVAAAALLVKRDDDRWFAIVAIWNNEKEGLDNERLDNLVRQGLKLCDAVGKPAEPAPVDENAIH
jgi:hypothetical protein